MSMGKSELDRCLESIGRARDRMEYIPQDDLRWVVLRALLHLANHVRQRVADIPALYPHQLNAAIANLTGRIEALENPANPLHQQAEPADACETGWIWHELMTEVERDCNDLDWDDMDALIAWRIGRESLELSRRLTDKFAEGKS